MRPLTATPTLIATIATLMVPGCSDPREDVRVTLCKDIVSVRIGPSAVVGTTETNTKGYENASVRVHYTDRAREARAVCYYDYKAVDDTADMLADPLSAYATSPFEVDIDGQKLSKFALAEAIKQAMLKQGSELIDRAKQGIEDAVQR